MPNCSLMTITRQALAVFVFVYILLCIMEGKRSQGRVTLHNLMLLNCALWHSGQVLYVQSADWTNDLRCFGCGWVSVWVCVGLWVFAAWVLVGVCVCVCMCGSREWFVSVYVLVSVSICMYIYMCVYVHVHVNLFF